MLKPKHFIAITTETLNDKLVLIATSLGKNLYSESGITFDKAIEFLYDLIHEKQDGTTTVFVNYAFGRDNEFIFSTMPRYLKDKLFKSAPVQQRILELEAENEDFDTSVYKARNNTTINVLDSILYRAINNICLTSLLDISYNNYDIKLVNGKFLSIKQGHRIITFYDIFGFFDPHTLRESVVAWLGKDLSLLDRQEIEKLTLSTRDKIALHSTLEVTAIQRLATKLDENLSENGFSLSKWHGASALSSKILSKSEAKKEYHAYKYKRQLAPELYKAMRQSYYGGRTEQFKIGTLNNVYVYDINSAYAYAVSHLPRCLQKPYFTETWNESAFSIWFCDYDLTSVNPYFGILPNRDTSNATKYKLKGSGYFWQPEIKYIKENFEGHCEIKGGFVFQQDRAEFAKGIETLYELRLELKRRDDPLERIIKLALASIYGKFCQQQGKGFYYNLFYAGFVTSFTRAKLLEATKGYEDRTITFQTDAIHSLSPLHNLNVVSVGNNFGGYSCAEYHKVTYLDNGVYRALDKDSNIVKTKTRGIKTFEFEKALRQLKQHQKYSALIDFFVSHNIYTNQMFSGAEYLKQFELEKEFDPIRAERSAMRLFEATGIDLSKQYFNSKPLRTFSGLESGVYRQNEHLTNAAKQTMGAGRI